MVWPSRHRPVSGPARRRRRTPCGGAMTLPPSFSTQIEDADDMVARRIVLRREVWDQLVHLAEALQATRELDVSPTDVAVIALEAGLAEVRKSSGQHGRPAK